MYFLYTPIKNQKRWIIGLIKSAMKGLTPLEFCYECTKSIRDALLDGSTF